MPKAAVFRAGVEDGIGRSAPISTIATASKGGRSRQIAVAGRPSPSSFALGMSKFAGWATAGHWRCRCITGHPESASVSAQAMDLPSVETAPSMTGGTHRAPRSAAQSL
jgi:hypothetical protein